MGADSHGGLDWLGPLRVLICFLCVNYDRQQELLESPCWQHTRCVLTREVIAQHSMELGSIVGMWCFPAPRGRSPHTRELTCAGKMSRMQQQRPESPRVTLSWHASKYKVHTLHQRELLSRLGAWLSVSAGQVCFLLATVC